MTEGRADREPVEPCPKDSLNIRVAWTEGPFHALYQYYYVGFSVLGMSKGMPGAQKWHGMVASFPNQFVKPRAEIAIDV